MCYIKYIISLHSPSSHIQRRTGIIRKDVIGKKHSFDFKGEEKINNKISLSIGITL